MTAGAQEARRARLPATFWLGAGIILVAGALLAADAAMRGWAVVPYEPLPAPAGPLQRAGRAVAAEITPIFWTAFLLLLDGLLVRLGGSPARERPRRFIACYLASVPIWVSFDAMNFAFLHAWDYHGLADDPLRRNLGYFLAFGAIAPAMFLVGEACRRAGLAGIGGPRLALGRKATATLVLLGAAGLAFPILVAAPAGTLTLWVAWVLLLDPLNDRLGAPSLLADWREGRWTRTLCLAAGGLVCGFLWEGWNWWATAKWTYDLPFLGPFEQVRYFEMPVLGLAGFPPFALECWVMFQTVLVGLGRIGLRRIEPLPDRDALL